MRAGASTFANAFFARKIRLRAAEIKQRANYPRRRRVARGGSGVRAHQKIRAGRASFPRYRRARRRRRHAHLGEIFSPLCHSVFCRSQASFFGASVLQVRSCRARSLIRRRITRYRRYDRIERVFRRRRRIPQLSFALRLLAGRVSARIARGRGAETLSRGTPARLP